MENVKAVYVLIQNDQKQVLMVLNKGASWTLPGGKVEENESLVEAAIRESKEETGLDTIIDSLLAVSEAKFQDKNWHVLFFTFEAHIIGGDFEIQMTDEIEELKWVNIDEANEYMPYFPEGIESLLQNRGAYINQMI